MTKIAYDPVKDRFAALVRRSRLLRNVFYSTLDLFFLRSWYVRSRLKELYNQHYADNDPWTILDAGSGFGQYDRYLLRGFSNSHIHAVDVKDQYLSDCRQFFQTDSEAGRIRFEQLDLVHQTLPSRTYDTVLCIDVLEHIERDEQVLSNISASLRPGGRLVMHSPSVYAEADAGEEDTFVDEHARTGYEAGDLAQRFQRAGLTVEEIRYTYGPKGHKAWEWLIKRPMLWFNRFGLYTLIWLPLYYLVMLPPGLFYMRMDMRSENTTGTGILGVARKL